jgi:16S rRNA (adenine1518-N6/adenine1519-N6)-dimethyltransferase
MGRVQPKKNLGQHFLKDTAIASRIAASLTGEGYSSVLEIGPGMGVLTSFLMERGFDDFRVIEIDNESVHYLHEHFPHLKKILTGDFLSMNVDTYFNDKMAIRKFPL